VGSAVVLVLAVWGGFLFLGSGGKDLIWLYSEKAGIEFTRSEVTVAQYRPCVEAGKCSTPKSKSDSEYCNWGYAFRGMHPINCVDWSEANAFCGWAGGRLPTEEEWFAEASNGGSRTFPWGDAEVTCEYAVWGNGNNTDGCWRDSTWPVCSKPKGLSVSGLCDLSGNVWEWTSTSEGFARVVRGGSWVDESPGGLRASGRGVFGPSGKGSHDGIRCVRSVKH
jgi:formylglycine-generating enzyme